MDEDFEFFYLNPTPTHIRGYMTAVRNKAREEGRRSALEEVKDLVAHSSYSIDPRGYVENRSEDVVSVCHEIIKDIDALISNK